MYYTQYIYNLCSLSSPLHGTNMQLLSKHRFPRSRHANIFRPSMPLLFGTSLAALFWARPSGFPYVRRSLCHDCVVCAVGPSPGPCGHCRVSIFGNMIVRRTAELPKFPILRLLRRPSPALGVNISRGRRGCHLTWPHDGTSQQKSLIWTWFEPLLNGEHALDLLLSQQTRSNGHLYPLSNSLLRRVRWPARYIGFSFSSVSTVALPGWKITGTELALGTLAVQQPRSLHRNQGAVMALFMWSNVIVHGLRPALVFQMSWR